MRILVAINSAGNEAALRAAAEIGAAASLPSGVLNAPLDSDCKYWIDNIWDRIESSLRRAYRDGVTAAKPLLDEATRWLDDLGKQFAKRADDVRVVIGERLNRYLQEAVDSALKRVRPVVSVGGRELTMTSVTLQQSVTLSGSLATSLEQLCEFVATGEITLSAEYSIQAIA